MPRRNKVFKKPCAFWSYRELINLAAGIQKYGFKDTEKLSEMIESKSPRQVKIFINYKIQEIRNAKRPKKIAVKVKRPRSYKNTEIFKDWTPLRKWKKIVENQLTRTGVKQDYSRIVMKNMFQKFDDEASITTNPQVLDVKAIYKFMLQCISGEVPSQLPIKESAFVLCLLRQMRESVERGDFKEQVEFIRNFRRPVEFIPAKTREECREKMTSNPEIVPIPTEIYEKLKLHRQLVTSFNPLGIPPWLMIKDKNYLQKLQGTATIQANPSTSGEG